MPVMSGPFLNPMAFRRRDLGYGSTWKPRRQTMYGDPSLHKERKVEPIKKFYVGAKHIGSAIRQGTNAGCTRTTIEEAIQEAKDMIVRENLECVVIVEIVRVVRKDYPPITVHTV